MTWGIGYNDHGKSLRSLLIGTKKEGFWNNYSQSLRYIQGGKGFNFLDLLKTGRMLNIITNSAKGLMRGSITK